MPKLELNENLGPRVGALVKSVTTGSGELSPGTRQALLEGGKSPAALAAYSAKVRRSSGKVSESDMAALREAGLGQDAIFEATVVAALKEGMARLARGRLLLKGGKP